MLSHNLKIMSACALMLLAFSNTQAADFADAQDPTPQTVPCKPDNSNCPHKKFGKGFGTILSAPQPTSAAGNPCAPGKPASGCLKWINGDVKIKPAPKK